MSLFDRLQPVLLLLAMGVGLALGQTPFVAARAGALIAPFLILMLTGVFLHVPLRGLGAAFRNRRFTAWNLALNFVWVPVFCWLLGWVFLPGQPDLRIGLLMLLATPCTDWYLVFTQVTGGNARLAAAQLPWHLVLQLLLLPLYLLLLAGLLVPLNLAALAGSVVWMLIVPLGAATVLRYAVARAAAAAWFEQRVLPRVPIGQSVFLLLAIVAMFAAQGATLLDRLDVLALMLPPLLTFYIASVAISRAVSRAAGFSPADATALCFATLCRNSPLSLAVAVMVFPDRPLIALALVLEPLIELPIVSLIAYVLRRREHARAVATLPPNAASAPQPAAPPPLGP